MKWFRHMTATWNDEKIAALIGKGNQEGMALYGAYWRVLEIVASQMKPDSQNPSVQYSVTRWSVLMSVRGSQVSHYLSQLMTSGVVTTEWNGSDIRVTIPNLLKYRDEYSGKSRHNRESVRLRSDTDTDTDTEKETNKEKPPSAAASVMCETQALQAPKAPSKMRLEFEELWSFVWLKTGKEKTWVKYRDKRSQGVSHALMLAAVREQSPHLKKRAIRFRPHPATWLFGGRYTDEPAAYIEQSEPETGGMTRIQRGVREGIQSVLRKQLMKESDGKIQ